MVRFLLRTIYFSLTEIQNCMKKYVWIVECCLWTNLNVWYMFMHETALRSKWNHFQWFSCIFLLNFRSNFICFFFFWFFTSLVLPMVILIMKNLTIFLKIFWISSTVNSFLITLIVFYLLISIFFIFFRSFSAIFFYFWFLFFHFLPFLSFVPLFTYFHRSFLSQFRENMLLLSSHFPIRMFQIESFRPFITNVESVRLNSDAVFYLVFNVV